MKIEKGEPLGVESLSGEGPKEGGKSTKTNDVWEILKEI